MKVNQIDISKDMKVSDLVAQFEASDVLGAGRVARATNILANMIKDEDTNVFMSLGGPLIPGGMRNIVSQMIREGHVDLIVSSGANLTHDLLEAFGGAHYRDEGKDDEELNAEGIGRIADINVGSNDFEVFEKEINRLFEIISAKKPVISIQELIYEIGMLIDDENSFIATAARNNGAGQLSGFRIGNSGVDNRCLGLLCGYGRYLCSQGCNRDDGVNTVSNRLITNLL